MVLQLTDVVVILWSITICSGEKSTATATRCTVFSLYYGHESKPWPWAVGTHAAISLLPENPRNTLQNLQITLNGLMQDHIVYFDQYDNVICRDGSRQESSFHQTPTNASTQLIYQWYHGIIDWHGGVLTINGHEVCSGMHLRHDIYNITLKYTELANGFAVFGCHQGCPIWDNSELKLYNKPLATGSVLVRRKYVQQSVSISLILDRCHSKLQQNCNETLIFTNGLRNHWTTLSWRDIAEVSVGDSTQSVNENNKEKTMQVYVEDSSNVLWTFLSSTCAHDMVGLEGNPFPAHQDKILTVDCGVNQLLLYSTIGLGTALVAAIILLGLCFIINRRWKPDSSSSSSTLYSRVDNVYDMNMSIITQDQQTMQK